MVLEQHIYQTNVDYAECQRKAKESPDVKNYLSSEKGLLIIRFKNCKAFAEITTKSKVMLYTDPSEFDKGWQMLKPILATIDGKPVEIKWLARVPQPDNIRLRALIQQADEEGSIESLLSIIDEVERMEKKKQRDPKKSLVPKQ